MVGVDGIEILLVANATISVGLYSLAYTKKEGEYPQRCGTENRLTDM